MHPNVHSSIIYNNQDKEITYMSINRWMDQKMPSVYTLEYYSVIEKNKLLPLWATQMDLEVIILSEIKGKYHIIPLMCEI